MNIIGKHYTCLLAAAESREKLDIVEEDELKCPKASRKLIYCLYNIFSSLISRVWTHIYIHIERERERESLIISFVYGI